MYSPFRSEEIMLVCDHSRTSRGSLKIFDEGKHQLSGSIKQPEHRWHNEVLVQNHDKQSHPSVKIQRKTSSVRPMSSSEYCSFSFPVFCSSVEETYGKWFIAASIRKKKANHYMHTNHLPMSTVHLSQPLSVLPEQIIDVIKLKIRSGSAAMAIVSEIRELYHVTISLTQVYNLKHQVVEDMVRSAGEHPSFSAAERLIQVFKTYKDVSYIYVKHDVSSGYVTYTKS